MPVDRRLVWGGAALGAVGGAALGYARFVEPRRLQVVRYRLTVPDLPPGLEGTTIAHLTDFHVGMRGTQGATLRRAVAWATARRPDLTVLTGDFTHDGLWRRRAGLFAGLARVSSVFAVLGNHDHLASEAATREIVRRLEAQGVRVLGNAHAEVAARTGRLLLVGVDDPHLDKDDLGAAMRGISASREPDRPAILLGHVPDIVERAAPGRFALTVAGHTHGGQLRFSPWKRFTPLEVPMVVGDLDSAYARGTHVVNGNPLLVSNGLGVSGVPLRFLAPPQVGLVTMVRGDEAGIEEET